MPYLIGSFEYPIGSDGNGFPDYTYSGASTIVDTGETSGEWKIALTSAGTFTLNKRTKVTIQIQGGGGGGGASNGASYGSDGLDGSVQTLENYALEAGSYVIAIGSAGSRGYDSSGYVGGVTKFGTLLTASAGAGGQYAGGNYGKTHVSIYGNYGKGGRGGSPYDYSGSATYKYVFTASRVTYMFNQPSSINGWNEGTLQAGQTVYLTSNTQHAANDGSSDKWYQTESGLYVSVDNGSAQYKLISDTRSWYGVAGTAGVVLLSGKA